MLKHRTARTEKIPVCNVGKRLCKSHDPLFIQLTITWHFEKVHVSVYILEPVSWLFLNNNCRMYKPDEQSILEIHGLQSSIFKYKLSFKIEVQSGNMNAAFIV